MKTSIINSLILSLSCICVSFLDIICGLTIDLGVLIITIVFVYVCGCVHDVHDNFHVVFLMINEIGNERT